MSYVLVEREKLGANAYRVNAILRTTDGVPLDAETGFEEIRKEIRKHPRRYDPAKGTHTLVLIGDAS